MTQDIPVISVRVGEPLPLSEIASKSPLLNESDIRFLLEAQIREHYSLYGTEPYKLEYSRSLDSYHLRPGAVIGLINCNSFILQISSKFKDIEIGKWLQLAHYSNATNLVRHNNDIAESALSEQDSFAGLDYFVLSLVSAVYDCVNQGLLYENTNWVGDDPHFRGKLHVAKYIKEGANPHRLQTIQACKSFDSRPNSIIRAALEICTSRCSNQKLRGLCNGLLPHFKDVVPTSIDSSGIDYEFVSSLPRPDYERALSLSKVIIEGFSALEGETKSFIPFYTIDLDKLFEAFVSYELKRLLKQGSYQVAIQRKVRHPIIPELAGNYISPDILVMPHSDKGGKTIVIDTKNKYSLLDESGTPKLANPDLFQMIYYCKTMKTNIAILVYPGDVSNHTKYPIPGSEGKARYDKKRDQTLRSMFKSGNCGFTFSPPDSENQIFLIAWRLNLSGTLHETRSSVAQLCQFTADCVKGEILAG